MLPWRASPPISGRDVLVGALATAPETTAVGCGVGEADAVRVLGLHLDDQPVAGVGGGEQVRRARRIRRSGAQLLPAASQRAHW